MIKDIDMSSKPDMKAMKIIAAIFLQMSVLFVSLSPLPALADDDREQDRALKLRQQGLILPLEKILQAAKSAHPGRVVEVELQREHKKYIYEVELVDNNGQVWELKLDAATARLIESERED